MGIALPRARRRRGVRLLRTHGRGRGDHAGLRRDDPGLRAAAGHRVRAGGHDLRLGAERLEAGRALRAGWVHRHHPRQVLPRGDEGDREPGHEVPERHATSWCSTWTRRGWSATSSRGGATPPRLAARFAGKTSPGFDFAADLQRVGVANQTTMLAGESLAIAAEFGLSMARRYGEAHRDEHFRTFDTICSATQERQDAVLALLEEPLDLMVVVGGYNSSNTCNLAAICAAKGVRTVPHRGRRLHRRGVGGRATPADSDQGRGTHRGVALRRPEDRLDRRRLDPQQQDR